MTQARAPRRTPSAVPASEASDRLVQDHLGLAQAVASSFRGRGVDLDDLRQVAGLALVKAARRYDPELGDFGPYAAASMRGDVKRYFRDRTWTVRPPRRLQELRLRLAKDAVDPERVTRDDMAAVAADLEVPVEDVVEAMRCGDDAVRSLDEASPPVLATSIAEALQAGFDDLEAHIDLWGALRRLGPVDRRVVLGYYFDGLSQQEIADQLGVSQMTVSRHLRRILADLRSELDDLGPDVA